MKSLPQHIHSTCAHFQTGDCRSCTQIELPYTSQLKKKQRALAHALSAANLDLTAIQPIVPADPPLGSRYKSKLAVTGSSKEPVLGYPKSDGSVQPIQHCPIVNPALNEIAQFLPELISNFNLTPYLIDKRTGELKYVILRQSWSYSDIQLRFVIRTPSLVPSLKEMAHNLIARFPSIRSLSVNFQPLPAAIVEGPQEELLRGESHMRERLADTELLFHTQSFSQVTPAIADKLYRRARSLVVEYKPPHLIDLYCGVGAFGLCSARMDIPLTGIEVNAQSVQAAELAAQINGFQNARFVRADANEYCNQTSARGGAIIVNPPRRGLSAKTLQYLLSSQAELILYSSCNPSSLSRDLVDLRSKFRVHSIEPFDMFPMTEHLEVMAVLLPQSSPSC